MENTYTWRINALDCHTNQNDLTDVVYNIHWSYIAENNEGGEPIPATGSIGVQTIEAPSAESFTPFESLTQETVVGWLEAKMGEERIAEMKANLDARIEEKINPTKVTKQLPVVE
jgi:hypothetical protein